MGGNECSHYARIIFFSKKKWIRSKIFTHFYPSSAKIKFQDGNLGSFFTGYTEWEVRSARIYKNLQKTTEIKLL